MPGACDHPNQTDQPSPRLRAAALTPPAFQDTKIFLLTFDSFNSCINRTSQYISPPSAAPSLLTPADRSTQLRGEFGWPKHLTPPRRSKTLAACHCARWRSSTDGNHFRSYSQLLSAYQCERPR